MRKTTMKLLLAAALVAVGMMTFGMGSLRAAEPVGLTADSLVNPAVTEDLSPRLGWKLPWTQRGATQLAYRILAASSAEKLAANEGDLWDSGEVKSDASVLVECGGKPLAPAQTVWWKVKAANESGEWSDWSKPAHFTTAKPWPEAWAAKWITYPDAAFADDNLFKPAAWRVPEKIPSFPKEWRVSKGDFIDRYVNDTAFGIEERWVKLPKDRTLDYTKDRLDEIPPSPMFRKEFALPGKVRRAVLHSSGLGWQELFLNGKRVGDGVNNPAPTEYREIGLYEAFDVTDFLRKGENALGVHIGCGWFQQGVAYEGNAVFGRLGLLLDLEYELEDGTKGRVVSDESWQTTLAGPVLKDNIYAGCLYDARREMSGWTEPGFSNPAWVPAAVAKKPLVPALEPAALPPVRITATVRDEAMKEVAPGVWQMDAKYICGYVRLKGIDAPAGTEITITYSDSLEPDGRICKTDSGAATAGAHKLDRYVCKGGGNEAFEPMFAFRGFRYAEISGLPPGVKPDAEAVNLRTDVARNGEFTCSEPMFNDFCDMVLRTLDSHMHGIIADNNTRERNQWLGGEMQTRDIFSWTYDMRPFWRKIVRDIETSTINSRPIDGKSYRIPKAATATTRTGGGDPVWPMALVKLADMTRVRYADTQIMAGAWPLIANLMDYCTAISPDGILNAPHSYGDHAEEAREIVKGLSKYPKTETPRKLTGSMHFHRCLELTANIADHLGKPDDAVCYRKTAEKVKAAIIREFYDSAKDTYGSQSGDSMGLVFGVYPDGRRKALADSLAAHVAARGGHLSVGVVNFPLLVQALSENGHGDLLYRMFKTEEYPGIGFMRAMGSKTIWEYWAGGIVYLPESLEHKQTFRSIRPVSQQALSSFADGLFYRAAAGIHPDPAHPGFKHFTLRPDWKFNANLAHARAAFTSPYGRIESDWKKGNGKLVWKITVPPNSTATAHIPAASKDAVTESGKPLTQAKGVEFLKMENGCAVCELQSGSYTFEAEMGKK